MATKKPSAKKKKKVTPKKRASKKKIVPKLEKEAVRDPSEPLMLYGDLFWEYRAKTAEWERTNSQLEFSILELGVEKKDPKYTKLLKMIRKEVALRRELKANADFLRHVQKRVSDRLGIELSDFLGRCVVDYDTGIVRFTD